MSESEYLFVYQRAPREVEDLDALQTRYLGVFAELLGIRPWEWDRLRLDEVYTLIAYLRKAHDVK